jgi:hypothetical protein
MRRELVTWSVVLGLILAAFGVLVLVLNATLYSPAGFVRGYLDALERQDSDTALDFIGNAQPGSASEELLRTDAMGEVTNVDLVTQTRLDDGTTRMTFSFVAGGTGGKATFEVKRAGSILGIFPTWEFAKSPLAVMHVAALHDPRFIANGVNLVSPSPNEPAPYLVFAPGSYVLAHESEFLEAAPVTVTASTPGGSIPTAVNTMPNQEFVGQVQQEVNDYLDNCATQQVLQPTGCPFGQVISNRVVSPPKWSIADYPAVTLDPGSAAGEWFMPRTDARAHLLVDVRSLFDGTVSTFDEDVPFAVSYTVTFISDTELLITADYRE